MHTPRLTLAAFLGVVALIALADPSASATRPTARWRTQQVDVQRRTDAGPINMWVTNLGSFGFDLTTGSPGLIYPKGSTTTALFAGGLWIGARVGGQTRVTVAEYNQEYQPGKMVSGLPDDPARPAYIVYKVVRYSGNAQDTSHVNRTPAELAADPSLDPLVHHSWSEYLAGAVPHGAPSRVHRLPLTVTPDPFDSVSVLGPDVLGDQMTWCVYNDANPSSHTTDAGATPPLGVEVRQSIATFTHTGAFGHTVLLDYDIANRGGQQLDDVSVSIWLDPDLGQFTDDVVGSDVGREMAYCYNGQPNDAQYGATPPALGITLLRGPIVAGDSIGLYATNAFVNGTDPVNAQESYNYMRGLNPDGTPRVDPTTGLPSGFAFTGDPVAGTGWRDTSPLDKRILISTGLFAMPPGATQRVRFALVIGRSCDRLASITTMRRFADFDRAGANLGLPDLLPLEICAPARVQGCGEFDVHYTIFNAGGDAGSSSARLSTSTPFLASPPFPLTSVVPPLGPGETFSDSAHVTFDPGSSRVTYTLTARADRLNQVLESNEGNNLSTAEVVHAVPLMTSLIQVADSPPQARVRFLKSERDSPGVATPVTAYEIYRRIQPGFAATARRAGVEHAGPITDPGLLLAGWDYVTSIPAHGESEYSTVVPLFPEVPAASGYESFLVRAATAFPTEFFDSCVDSMPQVDSLPPSTPANFRVTGASGDGGYDLAWEPSGSPDLAYYDVHRGPSPGFVPSAANRIARLSGNAVRDTSAHGQYPLFYKLTAKDLVGNLSPFAAATTQVVGIPPGADVPLHYALHPPSPNPTRREQTYQLDLPRPGTVRLRVFDVTGRQVRALASDAWMPAGRHAVRWDGRATNGRLVDAGFYVVEMSAGPFRARVKAVVAP